MTSAHDETSHSNLLRQRRFGPLFLTQFLGAFNDNVFKNALVLLIAFRGGQVLGLAPAVMVQAAAGLFVLPFFLFSATAGQLADKFEKGQLIRLVKLVEIGIAVLATVGFAAVHIEFLLGALFMMGLHSTMFGPLKYSILPQHLRSDELVAGNAWVESGTFVAILLGTISTGPLMAIGPHGPVLAGLCCIAVATTGYFASRFIPLAPATDPSLKIDLNPFTETAHNIRLAYKNRTVFHSLMGISWFWFYGAVFLSEFASYVKEVLGGNELMATGLLGTFIVGIALGSFLCERLSGKNVEVGLVPLGSIGLTVFGIDLWWASPSLAQHYADWHGFLAQRSNWHILFALVMLGASGGFFTVPLYALIQARSDVAQRARVIAANNIMNAAFMVVAALFAGLALQLGVSIAQLFLITALMNAVVAFYIYKLVPEFLMRFVVWMLIHTFYRLRMRGLENVPDEGAAIVVCNHVSFVDALVITAACRRPIRFVMDHRIYKMPIANFVFRETRAIPIAPAKDDPELLERAYDEIVAGLDAGDIIGIFPEGRITDTGEMYPFKGGISKILARRPVPVIPMALRGLWGSFFSRKDGPAMTNPFRVGIFPRIELVADAQISGDEVSPDILHAKVAALRGDWK
ncbi:MAG TPA: MFS transporter [Rhodocyclaceae bacterium]|nr:MFS transporter [Rhodocyclaceae bacterium]